ncbi:N-acetylmuramoyl-L-alanine amidase family protein, partial [Bacillus mycoides]|uniref:N-acetylmuramoyl-L-alanine amidase family protein n=1 Tax=Bacillus mycoides TaxID=1405 RepID=UPI003D2F7DBD
DGVMQTGSTSIDEITYNFDNSGALIPTGEARWIKDGSNKYYLKSNGVMQKGWLELEEKTYYFDNNGAMQKGWLQLDGKTHYFDSNGVMQTGLVKFGEKTYFFESRGGKQCSCQCIEMLRS